MKNILIVFSLACCLCLQAQTPPPPTNVAPAADPATIELARQAVRATISGDTNTVNPVTLAPAAPIGPAGLLAPTNVPTRRSRPAFPAFPAPGPRPQRNALTGSPGTLPLPPDAVPLIPPPTVFPMAHQPEPADVDINFPGMALDVVLDLYAKMVNRTVLQASLPPATITLKTQSPLTRTEAIQALESVLAMNNITLIPVGEKFVKVVNAGEAGKQAAPFDTNDDVRLPETDQYVTHIVQLKYIKTSDVMPAIQPLEQIAGSVIPLENNGLLIIRDYAANVKRMLELIKQMDINVPLDLVSEVIPIKYGKAEDIASALTSLGAGGGQSVGTRAGGSTARPAGTTGLGGATGLNGTTGYPAATATLGSTPGSAGGGGGARGSSFGQRVANLVSKAANAGDFQVFAQQTKIIADTRANSLLVFASKEDMLVIKDLINKLDTVLPQVLIEAIIMEVTLDKGVTTGVSYLQNLPGSSVGSFSGIGAIQNGTFLNPGSFVNTGSNAAALPSGLSYFANFGNDFQATVTAVADDSRINVLSRPRIQTSHGVAASLQVGQTVPEVTGTYFGGINGQASSQYQQTFVGINLQVTPLINSEGLVVMDIVQDVEQLGNPTTIDGNPVPTTSKRTAQATVSVRDRDTIILGGMISNSKTTTHSGVPLLKDIPGLGILFRSSADTSERVELIVLIHPTVLPTPESAALVTRHERDKLPAIKAAEAESRLDDIRRAKEADKIKMPKEAD